MATKSRTTKSKPRSRVRAGKKNNMNKILLGVVVALFVAVGAFVIFRVFAGSTKISGSQFSGTKVTDGAVNALKLTTTTPATATFATVDASDAITLRARADLCKGNPDAKLAPDAKIVIDGKTEVIMNVPSTTYADYTSSLVLPAGSHTIAINLTNPYNTIKGAGKRTCDKAIYVDYIQLSGPDVVKPTFTSITAGERNFCGILSDKTVACWGSNFWGQSGGSSFDGVDYIASQASIDRCIATNGYDNGGAYSCTDTIWNDDVVITRPYVIPGLNNVTKIASTQRETCAVSGGKVYCWGSNFYPGVFGNYTPTLKQGLEGVVDIGAQQYMDFCAYANGSSTITPTGVYCWGNTYKSGTPQLVTNISPSQLSNYPKQNCNITTGKVYCSGQNYWGQLGDGTTTDSSTPVEVQGIVGTPTSVVSDGLSTNCALASGTVYCWGNNWYGEVGQGTAGVFDPGAGGAYYYPEYSKGAPWYYNTAQKVTLP